MLNILHQKMIISIFSIIAVFAAAVIKRYYWDDNLQAHALSSDSESSETGEVEMSEHESIQSNESENDVVNNQEISTLESHIKAA